MDGRLIRWRTSLGRKARSTSLRLRRKETMLPAVRKVLLCLAASAALQVEPQAQPETTVEEELRRLQGSWQVETQEENGDKLAADDVKGRSILFGKDTFFIRHDNKVVQIGMLKLNPSKTPRTVNAVIMSGDKKGDIMQGIYALDGDSLKICLDTEGQERPKEFKTAPKSGHLLYVLKRVRVKGEDQELVGNYRSETTELDGKKHVLDVMIERVGDAYMVTYKKNNAVGFVGMGLA